MNRKYENFCKSLSNLHLVQTVEEPYDVMTLTGSAALFGICFEQAWKAMKEILLSHGFAESQTGSPKQILKLAYSAGMLHDETQWLAMLASRNDVSHSYNEETAKALIQRVKADYIDLLDTLQQEMEARWL